VLYLVRGLAGGGPTPQPVWLWSTSPFERGAKHGAVNSIDFSRHQKTLKFRYGTMMMVPIFKNRI
jgi:hypothetical protein